VSVLRRLRWLILLVTGKLDGEDFFFWGNPFLEETSTSKMAQYFRAIFCNKDWDMDHTDMKIQQVVVMYLHDHQISRPPAPAIVSPCKSIMSCFSFMFLGVPRHYARRSFRCWCTACSCVRDRGHGSKSCGPNLMVEGCTRTKRTFWTEDEFTVTVSSGIRNRDVRVPEIVVRELEKAKPDKWGYVQARELWSPQEERQVCPGHFWLLKFGKVPGSNNCVEQKFQLGTLKYEEYKGVRFGNGDCDLVVGVLFHRVDEDPSGLTFEEWDPSGNDRQLVRAARRRFRPQRSATTGTRDDGVWRSRRRVEDSAHTVRPSSRFTTWVPGGIHSPWITTMSSGHDVSEYELGPSGLPRAYVSPQQPWKN
jgi:hypothetical protein